MRFDNVNKINEIARAEKGPKNLRHVGRDKDKYDPYGATADCLSKKEYSAKSVGTAARSSLSSAHSRELWPLTIFGKKDFGAQIAHLMPAGPTHADTWWFVVPLLLGGWYPPTNEIWESWPVLQKAIHGAARPQTDQQNNQGKDQGDVDAGEEQQGKRTKHSGIKHMVTNKARIPGQAVYLDQNPCLLIVPIMTKDQVKKWDGSGYEAIVLVDRYEKKVMHQEIPVVYELDEVVMNTGMDEKSDFLANEAEIETARELLEFFLQAIFTAHGKRPEGAPSSVFDLPIPIPPYMITVPSGLKSGSHRVRKIKFEAHAVDQYPLAPDPILLTSKAAVVFSTRHGQRLAAGAEPQDDDGWTDLDELAVEEYLEWKQEIKTENMDSELINSVVAVKNESTTAGNTHEISPDRDSLPAGGRRIMLGS
jgi:hypothetical protein